MCPPPLSVMSSKHDLLISSPILKSSVERAEPFNMLFEFVKTKHGLLKYYLIRAAIIPIKPS